LRRALNILGVEAMMAAARACDRVTGGAADKMPRADKRMGTTCATIIASAPALRTGKERTLALPATSIAAGRAHIGAIDFEHLVRKGLGAARIMT
jgi:hypothetical protein